MYLDQQISIITILNPTLLKLTLTPKPNAVLTLHWQVIFSTSVNIAARSCVKHELQNICATETYTVKSLI